MGGAATGLAGYGWLRWVGWGCPVALRAAQMMVIAWLLGREDWVSREARIARVSIRPCERGWFGAEQTLAGGSAGSGR